MYPILIERSQLVLQGLDTSLSSPLVAGEQYFFAALEVQSIRIIAKSMYINIPVKHERMRRSRERALNLARFPLETFDADPRKLGILHTGTDQEGSLAPQIVKDKIFPSRWDGRENPEAASPALEEHIVKRLGSREGCFNILTALGVHGIGHDFSDTGRRIEQGLETGQRLLAAAHGRVEGRPCGQCEAGI